MGKEGPGIAFIPKEGGGEKKRGKAFPFDFRRKQASVFLGPTGEGRKGAPASFNKGGRRGKINSFQLYKKDQNSPSSCGEGEKRERPHVGA